MEILSGEPGPSAAPGKVMPTGRGSGTRDSGFRKKDIGVDVGGAMKNYARR